MTEWRNRIVETRMVDAADLQSHKLNPRRHPEGQKRAVAGLLSEVGIVDSLTVYWSAAQDSYVVLDGHLRKDMGGMWPVNVLDVDDAEADLILATFDYTTSLAELDGAALADLLARVEMTPVEDVGVQELLAQLAEQTGAKPSKVAVDADPQMDRAEELAAKWLTAPDQIWQIAQHFVICGDCRQPETWQRLLAAAGVDEVNGAFTSPPYAEQRKEQYGGTPADEYVDWWEAVQANVKANLAEDGSFFINIKPHCEDGQRVLYVMDLVLAMVRRWSWLLIDESAWVHQGYPGEPQRRFQNAWEPIYCFSLGNPKFRPGNVSYISDSVIQYEEGLNLRQRQRATAGLSAQSQVKHAQGKAYPRNVLKVSTAKADMPGHAAAFPVDLPDFFIRAYSDIGDVWVDPFLGSGTTIVAAHQNARVGMGIEMLPKYVGVILERLQTITGQMPVLLEAA